MQIQRDTLAHFWTKLGHMLKGGVGLLSTLEVLHAEHSADPLGPALDRIARRLLDGELFGRAIEDEPDLFGRDTVLMVQVAEYNGGLDAAALSIGALVADGTLGVPSPGTAPGGRLPALADRPDAAGPLIREALALGATDVHVEPAPEGGIVRFRIGADLQPARALDADAYRRLLVSLKILAQLDLAEQRLPQDGRVRLRFDDRYHRLSVNTLPSASGEAACIRFDPPAPATVPPLESVFDDGDLARDLVSLATRRGTLLLVTGVTASGKTSTVRALLRGLPLTHRKVFSIGDRAGEPLASVHQLQPKPWLGLTYASALRSALRSDPDLLCVANIPDRETGEAAVRAAATGCTVIAELASSDAPAALDRLLELGIPRAALDAVLAGILVVRRPAPATAQRTYELVRSPASPPPPH